MSAKLHPKTFSFLKELKRNNNKPWFDKNKPRFDEIKNDFTTVVAELIEGLNKIDKTIGDLDAKKCVYRIYRDIRFSKDKTPYKTNVAAEVSRGGRKSKFAGYYFHLEPGGNSYIGGGVWRPEPDEMKKVRQEIDYNFSDFKKIVEKKSFVKQFGKPYDDKQKTVPQSYSAENPAIEYLKYKSFIYGCGIDDKTVASPNFTKEVLKICKELSPFILFLNKGLE